jgi:hypothetical protein
MRVALTFTKKKPQAQDEDGGTTTMEKPASAPQVSAPKLGWLKQGNAAKQAMAYEEAKAEERKAEAGRLWRFYVKKGEDAQITFLDGALDADGMLDIMMFYEHRLHIAGDWENFVCTSEADQTQPCPICAKGDKPSLVGVMTVVDHTKRTIAKGPNAGKVIANRRKLFVAKQHTIRQLNKLAAKRGGLVGVTFDVSREGDKDPAVGSMFDFVHKYASLAELAQTLDLKIEDVQPANYQEEIRYRSPEELLALGVGKVQIGVGNEKGYSSFKDEL